MGKWLILFLILIIAQQVSALSCVGISQGAKWDRVELEHGVTSYFSTRVYNSSASGGYCEPADYVVTLRIEDTRFQFEKIFDAEVKPEKMFLGNGGNKQVLLTLIPKVSDGNYTVLVRATRQNPQAGGGTMIVSASTAKINVVVGSNPDSEYLEVPFWTVRKDCPGGFVVRQGEICPRAVCEDGNFVYGSQLCPEEIEKQRLEAEKLAAEEGEKTEPVEEAGIPIEIIAVAAIALIACAALVFAFVYIKRLKGELKGRRLG